MFSKSVSIPALLALGLVAVLPSANAQLLLSGNAYGVFVDPMVAHTTVSNGPVTSVFESGVPYRPAAPYNDETTAITFNGQSFTDVGDGEALVLGGLSIRNGVTLLGTTASHAAMDLYLDLSSHGLSAFKLTTLSFSIDSTANNAGAGNVPDLFGVSHSPLNSLTLGGYMASFGLVFSDPAFLSSLGKSIAEGSTATTGDVYLNVAFTPVPEPSTYAAMGALVLVGAVCYRRFRRPSAVA